MRVALGLKAHSGWAALVVVGDGQRALEVLDRRRIELIEDRNTHWPGQPYHAAENLPAAQAQAVVQRGIDEARRSGGNELRAAIKRMRDAGHDIIACAVLMPAPMPDWSTGEILAVHMRMHKAEGVLYPDALARAAKACRMNLIAVPEKTLGDQVGEALGLSLVSAAGRAAALGKRVGPPWGADQKKAALAAMIALASAG